MLSLCCRLLVCVLFDFSSLSVFKSIGAFLKKKNYYTSWLNVRIRSSAYINRPLSTHTNTRTCTCTHARMHKHTHIHAHTHTRTSAYWHTNTHIHTHTHISHTHTPPRPAMSVVFRLLAYAYSESEAVPIISPLVVSQECHIPLRNTQRGTVQNSRENQNHYITEPEKAYARHVWNKRNGSTMDSLSSLHIKQHIWVSEWYIALLSAHEIRIAGAWIGLHITMYVKDIA